MENRYVKDTCIHYAAKVQDWQNHCPTKSCEKTHRMRLEPQLKDSRHFSRKFLSIKINKPGIFIEKRSYCFTNIAVFYKSSLTVMNNARQNIFYSNGYNLRHNFCICIYERNRSPIFYKGIRRIFYKGAIFSFLFNKRDKCLFLKAKIRRYSARLSRIIVLLFNKLITKQPKSL